MPATGPTHTQICSLHSYLCRYSRQRSPWLAPQSPLYSCCASWWRAFAPSARLRLRLPPLTSRKQMQVNPTLRLLLLLALARLCTCRASRLVMSACMRDHCEMLSLFLPAIDPAVTSKLRCSLALLSECSITSVQLMQARSWTTPGLAAACSPPHAVRSLCLPMCTCL